MTESGQSFGFPLTISSLSDVGRVRTNNEDSFGHSWLSDGSLFVMVADGMGGHEAGEVASGLAVQVVAEVVGRDPDGDPVSRMHDALLEANGAILEEGQRSGTRGMGTTAISVLCKGQQAWVALIGDSRCYQIRHGHLVWRSLDHTRVQMLVDAGEISEEESRTHPEAGMLTRALGHDRMADGRPLQPDVLPEPLWIEMDDALVLCSDGLHDLVEDWEIGQIVAGKSPEEAAAALVETACDRGGHDNVTVAVISGGDRASDYDPDFAPVMTAGFGNNRYGSNDSTDEERTDQGTPAPQYVQMAAGPAPSATHRQPIPVSATTGVINPAQLAAMAGPPPRTGPNKLLIGAAVAMVLFGLLFIVLSVVAVVVYSQMG